MSDWEKDVEGWLTVLREDGPTPTEEARHRARLVALGLLAGGSVMAGSHAAQAAAGKAVGAIPGSAVAPAPSTVGVASASGGGAVVAGVGGKVLALGTGAKALAVAAFATVGLVPALWMASEEAASPSPDAKHEVPGVEGTRGAEGDDSVHPSATEQPAALPKVQVAAVGDRSSAREKASRLRAETSLIERALAAEHRSDWSGALRLLDEHGRRFPDGALAEERDQNRARIQLKRGAPVGERDQKNAGGN